MAGTSFLAGELVSLMRHAREKRAKEARDLKGEKFKTNMAARGFQELLHHGRRAGIEKTIQIRVVSGETTFILHI